MTLSSPNYDPIPAPVCHCTHGKGNHLDGPCIITRCDCQGYRENTADHARRMEAWRERYRRRETR